MGDTNHSCPTATVETCLHRRSNVLVWLGRNRPSRGWDHRQRNNLNTKAMKKRLIATFMLIIYSAILIKVMVFKDVPLIRMGSLRINFGGSHEGPANLLPLKTILPYLLGKKGLIIAGINLVGNVVLLCQLDFLFRSSFGTWHGKKRSLLQLPQVLPSRECKQCYTWAYLISMT